MSPQGTYANTSTLKRHPRYYIQDDTVTFLVEDQLFACPRYFFEWESEAFTSIYLQPHRNSSRETVISLPGVKACELASLLDYFVLRYARFFVFNCPGLFAHNTTRAHIGLKSQSRRNIPMPQSHWLNLLSIATRFDFDEIRESAIKELETCCPPLDPVSKLELAGRYQIQQWFQPAYLCLCERSTGLSDTEGRRVGSEFGNRIHRARLLHREQRYHPDVRYRLEDATPFVPLDNLPLIARL